MDVSIENPNKESEDAPSLDPQNWFGPFSPGQIYLGILMILVLLVILLYISYGGVMKQKNGRSGDQNQIIEIENLISAINAD